MNFYIGVFICIYVQYCKFNSKQFSTSNRITGVQAQVTPLMYAGACSNKDASQSKMTWEEVCNGWYWKQVSCFTQSTFANVRNDTFWDPGSSKCHCHFQSLEENWCGDEAAGLQLNLDSNHLVETAGSKRHTHKTLQVYIDKSKKTNQQLWIWGFSLAICHPFCIHVPLNTGYFSRRHLVDFHYARLFGCLCPMQ